MHYDSLFRKQPLTINEFITENPHCEQIIQCIYGLNYLEFQLFCSLLTYGDNDVQELMKLVDREDRTKVNRGLKKLVEVNLITREKSTEKQKQGYRYIYSARKLVDIQDELKHRIDAWYSSISKELVDLEGKFHQRLETKQQNSS